MIDKNKLKGRMALMGYTQKSLAAEMNLRNIKITENTLSSKINGKSKFNCDDAGVICDILKVVNAADKAEIFLA